MASQFYVAVRSESVSNRSYEPHPNELTVSRLVSPGMFMSDSWQSSAVCGGERGERSLAERAVLSNREAIKKGRRTDERGGLQTGMARLAVFTAVVMDSTGSGGLVFKS